MVLRYSKEATQTPIPSKISSRSSALNAASLRGLGRELKFRAYEYGKGLMQNPEWFLMRRLARSGTIRALSHRLRQRHYAVGLQQQPARSQDLDPLSKEAVVAVLEHTGLYAGLRLSDTTVAELQTFAQTYPCYGNGKPHLGFLYRDRHQARKRCSQNILSGHYLNLDHQCAAVDRLRQDPAILAIAADYLQTAPAYLGSQLWWSFPGSADPAERCQISQAFHYDLDGYRFIKFFFYLSDVDESSGPHVFVRGSHHQMRWHHRLLRKRYSDREILGTYGAAAVATLCGPPGYGFIEDTFCFHKGTVPTDRDRLMLQIEFGIKDYGMQHRRVPSEKLSLIPLG